jgi:zinc transport system ATP-binding protein
LLIPKFMKKIVELKNVYFSYNGVPVLSDINLDIMERDIMAVIGPNGGGKTTLLKIILGLLKPSKGKVLVLGKKPEEGRKRVGYLQQNPGIDLSFPMSAYEAVIMGRYKGPLKRYDIGDREAAYEALELVGMGKMAGRHISMLSGGQLQRVLIARAIARKPELLLMDEPLSNIDAGTQKSVYELFLRLGEKMSVVFVTHDISAISSYVEKVACLNRKLYYHGPKEGSLGKLEDAYGCPIEMIAHGVPHRVLKSHVED